MVAEGKNGTVYLGDGNYGAVPMANCELNHELDIFATSSHQNNFWITYITP
jgi:hypothetical protein